MRAATRTHGPAGNSQNARFCCLLVEAIDRVVQGDSTFKQFGWKRLGEQITGGFLAYDDSVVHDDVLKYTKRWLHDNMFHPLIILKAMDLAGGTLGYEGYKIIRSCETCGRKSYRGLLPLTSDLQKWAKVVEKAGSVLCPFKFEDTEHGKSLSFDYERALLLIFRRFGMMEAGRLRGLSVDQALDGGRLSKNENQVCNGIGIVDVSAQCPETGEYLLADPRSANAQSRNL